MAASSSLEARARARRRRELLRKKRIRRCVSLTIVAIIIILIIVGISSLVKAISNNAKKTTPDTPAITQQATEGQSTTSQPPTITASIDGSVTGSHTINDSSSPKDMAKELGIPSPDDENDLIQIIADANQKKHCYLTFEDGPSEVSTKILDVLRKHNIKATFFMTADTIKKSPDIARRIHEEGHLIANRIVLDNHDKVYADTEAFMTALENSEASIKDIMNSGDKMFNLVRLPGGTPEYTSSNQYKEMKLDCMELLEDEGYYYCDWNTSNGDDSGSKTAKQLYTSFVDSSKGYNNLIVSMHDSASKETTAEALDDIINYLYDNEYTFHRLDDIDYNPDGSDSNAEQDDEE